MDEIEQNKVVVVDDEKPIVAVICEILDDDNIKAVACDDGSKALDRIYAEQPNLVVLDVQMPGMDGIQIFEQMRANPQTASIPVIFFTANSSIVNQRIPNYQEQNAALLPKPVSLVTFLDLVRSMLAHQ
jgi:CheY-like chemotaxis protein